MKKLAKTKLIYLLLIIKNWFNEKLTKPWQNEITSWNISEIYMGLYMYIHMYTHPIHRKPKY